MAISKWKIAKYLFPIIVLIGVGVISKSWSTEVIAYDEFKTEENLEQPTVLETEENLGFKKCDSIFQSLFPKNQDSIRIWDAINVKLNNESFVNENHRKLFNYLKDSRSDKLTIQLPLQGIYTIKNRPVSVIAEVNWEKTNDNYRKKSADLDLIKSYHPDVVTILEYEQVAYFDDVLQEEFKDQTTVFTYSDTQKKEVSVNKIGYYMDECLEYTSYTFDEENPNVLLGSSLDLDLELGSYTVVDSLLNKISLEDCRDCADGIENMKTFAKLKGFDNIYFPYSHYEKTEGFPHLPSRAVVYIENNAHVRFLWEDQVDLFGCSCL